MFGDGGIFAVDHTGDDKKAVIEFFDFGSLIDVDDVFDDQGVELEHIGQTAEGGFRAEADDVDPEAWAGGGNGVEFIDVSDFLFDRIVTETDDADGGGDGGGVDEYLAGSITGSCSTFPGVFFGFAVFLFRHNVNENE